MKLWKWLGLGRTATHGGTGQWPEVGEWLEVEGELKPCVNGLHLCREKDLVMWCSEELYEAEYDGEIVEVDDKVVVRRARLLRRVVTWTDRTARLFACDCAEHVLPIYENKYPGDKRPRQSIEVSRRYANGEATDEELAAAGSAAWSAAWSAAEYAAGSAARYADKSEAESAERAWQAEKLMAYLYPEEEA